MLSILVPLLICAPWTVDLLDLPEAWEPKPDWVGLARAADYALEVGEGLTLTASSPHCAMKWRRTLRSSPLELTPYLVVEMRAVGLEAPPGQYLLWMDDGSRDGRDLLATFDAPLDGVWHTLTLDLRRLGLTGEPAALALQVIAGAEAATLELRRLAFSATPPPDARLLPSAGPPTEPIVLDLGVPEDWTEQPAWLGNPGEAEVEFAEHGLRLSVAANGRGMKWSRSLAEPVELGRRRHVTLTYRGGGGGASDYALALLGDQERGEQYTAVFPGQALRYDGETHVASAEIPDRPSRVSVVSGLALQVQALKPGAWLEVESIVLDDEPRLQPIDSLTLFAGEAQPGPWRILRRMAHAEQTDPVDLGIEALPRVAGLSGDLPRGRLAACGVPFDSRGGGAAWLRWGARGSLEIPLGVAGSELFLLVASGMVGNDDPVRGAAALQHLPGPDRFVAEVRYPDGVVECIPAVVPATARGEWRWGLPEGVAVLRCPLDPTRTADSLTLRLLTDQVALAVLGATVREGAALFTPPDSVLHRVSLPTAAVPLAHPTEPAEWVTEDGDVVHLETATTRVTLSRTGAPTLRAIYHKPLGRDILARPVPLLRLRLGGEETPDEYLRTQRAALRDGVYEFSHVGDGVEWTMRWSRDGDAIGFDIEVSSVEGGSRVEVLYPPIPTRMGGRGEPTYCFPSMTPTIGSEDRDLSAPYAGWGIRHPFLTVQTPDGLASVMIEARDPGIGSLGLFKRGEEVALGVTPRFVDASADPTRVPGYRIQCLAGDWHTALEVYRAGLPEPEAPRPQWVRGIWNFRQRFLHWLDPLWVDRSQPVDLWPAVHEAEEAFGGIEYLHIFDWGTVPDLGRIYHRPGDPDPSEHWTGGYPAMRAAMEELQSSGIPVGLYIEGYLLETRGPLGQRIGERVAIIDEEGAPRFWPDATEVFACPWIEEWRQLQAETYARAATNLGPSGIYIDEFGFCSTYRDCYSADHGHSVPMNQIEAEHGFVREVRHSLDGVDPGVILYTEESPPDSNAPLQDASFTYAMNQCLAAGVDVPVNLYRFVHPGFKTIEILYCDKPTGSWATGVAWTFFNGEALWLEGPPDEWFAPQTLQMIRKCHGLLSSHGATFGSDAVTPLAPTLASGIHANRFEGPDEVVFTLYNEGYVTYDGPVLLLPDGFEGAATDLWNGVPAEVSELQGRLVLHARVGPRSVGCVSVARR